jgi:hypothetical protein
LPRKAGKVSPKNKAERCSTTLSLVPHSSFFSSRMCVICLA